MGCKFSLNLINSVSNLPRYSLYILYSSQKQEQTTHILGLRIQVTQTWRRTISRRPPRQTPPPGPRVRQYTASACNE